MKEMKRNPFKELDVIAIVCLRVCDLFLFSTKYYSLSLSLSLFPPQNDTELESSIVSIQRRGEEKKRY